MKIKKSDLTFMMTAGKASTTAFDRGTEKKLGRAVSVDVYRDNADGRYLIPSGCSNLHTFARKLNPNQVEQWLDFGPTESANEMAWAFDICGFTSCINS